MQNYNTFCYRLIFGQIMTIEPINEMISYVFLRCLTTADEKQKQFEPLFPLAFNFERWWWSRSGLCRWWIQDYMASGHMQHCKIYVNWYIRAVHKWQMHFTDCKWKIKADTSKKKTGNFLFICKNLQMSAMNGDQEDIVHNFKLTIADLLPKMIYKLKKCGFYFAF